MKKIFATLFAVMFIATGAAFACTGSNCLDTASATAIANPWNGDFSNNPAGNASGGFLVESYGTMQVSAYGQGTKSATADAIATGKAFGIGGAAGISTPHFGIGVSGAVSGVTLAGGGIATGTDKYSWSKNPDYASVSTYYSGFATQGNSILVQNGAGTFAGGSNQTETGFGGSSYDDSYGKIYVCGWPIDAGIPAIAGSASGGFGAAAGVSFGTYVDVPNFAAASAFTIGGSMYNADYGYVKGTGIAQHQAFAKGSENPSSGLSAGTATFCYEGANMGAGYAKTGGFSVIQNGPNSTSVTSVSSARSGSSVGGGYSMPTQK